jgi:hypothetical protein
VVGMTPDGIDDVGAESVSLSNTELESLELNDAMAGWGERNRC